MELLIPATSHQITWSIQNLTDATTYYVQAIIRDVRTETILNTVNLTNLGNGRFSGLWRVPQDPTGFGREIEIEKTVYTDSGYTTASEIYGRWLDRCLIFNVANRTSSTGGSGSSIDYKHIAELMRKELAGISAELLRVSKQEPPEKVNLDPITEGLRGVMSGISGLSKRISQVEDSVGIHDSKIEDSSGQSKQEILSLRNELENLSENLNRITSAIQDVEKTVHEKATERMDMLSSFEQKINSELTKVMKTFTGLMRDEGQKIHSDLKETLTQPIHLSLGPATPPPPARKGPSREDSISRMLTS